MTCICGYVWCWTCGFSKDNFLHSSLLQNGLICNFINSFLFGYELEVRLHWFFRAILCLIGLCLFPLIIFVYLWIALTLDLYQWSFLSNEDSFFHFWKRRNPIVWLLIVLPVNLVLLFLFVLLALLASLLLTVISTVVVWLVLLMLTPIVLYRCWASKVKDQSKQQTLDL